MATYATPRKLKVSFTLPPEMVEFVKKTRIDRNAGSDSEALNMLLQDAAQQEQLRQLEAATKDYYDNATDEELSEQDAWARGAGPNLFVGVPE